MTALAGVANDPLIRQRLAYGLLALVITGAAFAVGMLVTDRTVLTMLAAVGLIVGLASLIRPSMATYVVVAILYSNAAAVAVSHHGLPFFIGLAFPLALALPLAEQILLRRKPITITSGFPFLVGYLLVQLASTGAAVNLPNALDWLVIFLIGGFGLYFVVTNVVRDFATLRKIIWIVVISGALMGALTTFQYVTNTQENDYFGFAQISWPGRGVGEPINLEELSPRAAGPIGEKNRFGQVLVVLVPLAAVLALTERRRLLRLVAASSTLLLLAGMATTYSRGAAVGLVAIFVVAMLFRYVKPIHAVGLLIALVLALSAFPRYAERLEGLQGIFYLDRTARTTTSVGDAENLRGRATETLTALLMFRDHPFIGVGRGQSTAYHRQYARELAASGFDARIHQTNRPHNLYTGILAETGALGFIFFIAIFAVTLRDLLRARRRWLKERPEIAHLASGFFLAIVGYMASSVALHLSYERYLWLLLALAGITAHLALHGRVDGQVPATAAQSPYSQSV